MKTKCDKHPKYTGKRQPKYQCWGCLDLYIKLHSAPRSPHKPTKTFKTAKDYTRKSKHKPEELP
jgi:hypothetical protein